jgi:hypothetical protein
MDGALPPKIRGFVGLCLLALGCHAGRAAAQDAAPTVGLTVEPAGYATYPIPSRAAEAAYYLSPASALSVSYARGSTTQLLAESYAELLLLRFKYLFGAVSHLNLGLGERRLGYKYDVLTTSGETSTAERSMDVLVGELSFGTHLNFGVLQVGCDWAGVAVPLARLGGKNEEPSDLAASEAGSDSEALKRVAYVSTLQFMRVFVGTVF